MKLIEEHQMKNILSTCCPAVVTYVEKNFPELVDQLAPVVSPMIAHGYDLKERYPGVKTVFLTPCIAKQKEAADPRFAGGHRRGVNDAGSFCLAERRTCKRG